MRSGLIGLELLPSGRGLWALRDTEMISFMPTQRYSPEQIQSFIQDAKRDGFVVLRNHFSRESLQP